MILNPILMIVLAGVSIVAGTVGLIQTGRLVSIVPFVVFTFLFCVSLLSPVVKKAQLVASCQVALKTLIQVTKLSAEWLSAFGHYGARYLAQKRFEMGRARRAKSMVDG